MSIDINKIHTTKLGIDRIKKNLNIDIDDVVSYCKDLINDKRCKTTIVGKNYYCKINNIIITINKYTNTIITAHIMKED